MTTMTDLLPLTDRDPGDNEPIIIAGPCSAETEEQTLDTARTLAKHGIRIFRAGIWKPRTKPGGFEGVGKPGLQWLRRVKEETGMTVATEVAMRQHVDDAPRRRYRHALDRRPHIGQPVRHAGDSRRPERARSRHTGARQEPRQPRSRTVDRRARTPLQCRSAPPRSHPPRIQRLRPAHLPQPAAVAHTHRAGTAGCRRCRYFATRAT